MEQFAKEVMKPLRRPAEFKQVISDGVDDIWAMDLADMYEWENENNGYKFILVVVDVFSRYAWCKPLKNKNANEVWDVFYSIVRTGVKPNKIWVDKGTEFYNKLWTKKLEELGIQRYSTFGGEYKVSIAERFIRTIKTKLWYQFVVRGSHKWIDILQPEVDTYNKTIHSTIEMTPLEAREPRNANGLYGLIQEMPLGKPKYKLNQWVRIARIKGRFEKGFHANFSAEIFKIAGINLNKPVMYQVADYDGKLIDGSFYEEELTPVKNPDYFPVEEVLQRRGRKVLVKYMGYKEPQWIDADRIL